MLLLRRLSSIVFAIAVVSTGPAGTAQALEAGGPRAFAPVPAWRGDFEGMVLRKRVRVLVAFDSTYFFPERGSFHGLSVPTLERFQTHLNDGRSTDESIIVEVIPTHRNQLIQALKVGRGDLVVGELDFRKKETGEVGNSKPIVSGVSEHLVTTANQPTVTDISEFAGLTIHVRKPSPRFDTVENINQELEKRKLEPVPMTRWTMAHWSNS
jgi:membrane-bound lytic murein transglycosylase MltF